MAESNLAESAEIYSDMVRSLTDQELVLILALSMTPDEANAAHFILLIESALSITTEDTE